MITIVLRRRSFGKLAVGQPNNWLGHSPQILKLGRLIEYLIRNIFMEKVYRKPAVKLVLYVFLVW